VGDSTRKGGKEQVGLPILALYAGAKEATLEFIALGGNGRAIFPRRGTEGGGTLVSVPRLKERRKGGYILSLLKRKSCFYPSR